MLLHEVRGSTLTSLGLGGKGDSAPSPRSGRGYLNLDRRATQKGFHTLDAYHYSTCPQGLSPRTIVWPPIVRQRGEAEAQAEEFPKREPDQACTMSIAADPILTYFASRLATRLTSRRW